MMASEEAEKRASRREIVGGANDTAQCSDSSASRDNNRNGDICVMVQGQESLFGGIGMQYLGVFKRFVFCFLRVCGLCGGGEDSPSNVIIKEVCCRIVWPAG